MSTEQQEADLGVEEDIPEPEPLSEARQVQAQLRALAETLTDEIEWLSEVRTLNIPDATRIITSAFAIMVSISSASATKKKES